MVIIENKFFKLEISDTCVAKSLVLKATGEECLKEESPLFSLTQDRPYSNEIKLIYPNKRTTFEANRIRREGNKLIVGFELVAFEAVVEVCEKDGFASFTLAEFIVPEDAYGSGCAFINPPPIQKIRLLNLLVAKRENFGRWLNAAWDEAVAIGVLSTSPYTLVDSEINESGYLMYADATKETRLLGSGAALIAAPYDRFLDCIDEMEEYFDLPRGVKSRRDESINESIYWTDDIDLSNVDQNIAYAKKGGFRKMLIYSNSFTEGWVYKKLGDYEFKDKYPRGIEDLKVILKKLKKEGITPGIHFLHSHIGLESKYITPVADHRLNLTQHFTLAKPVFEDDSVIYVEENPLGAPLNPMFQVLKFNGELIHYDSYQTEYPYCFKGCKRGYYNTNVISHSMGLIGGILDISEFGGMSVYIDERTSLQDEIAEKLANIYNAGFEFIYFDGSEGVNPPFEFNVPYAQYKVYERLEKKPLFCEGAAKAHFGWHMLSGGNAFDVFKPEVFKEKIVEFPLNATGIMAKDFTRINFGWWRFFENTQPDMYEFGLGKAVAFDCAATVIFPLDEVEKNPRAEDVLEVLYRWEDVRRKKWLTPEQEEMLKNPKQEYILIVNEEKEYELLPYYPIKNVAGKDETVSAFYFERNERVYAVCWHKSGEGRLRLSLKPEDVLYEEQLGEGNVKFEKTDDGIVIPVSKRRYLSAKVSKEELINAFEAAEIID